MPNFMRPGSIHYHLHYQTRTEKLQRANRKTAAKTQVLKLRLLFHNFRLDEVMSHTHDIYFLQQFNLKFNRTFADIT